jgi:hypothetical protein
MRRISSSYYVRIKPQLNGKNAVHREDCPFLPGIGERIYLGEFSNSQEALRMARLYYPTASLCYFCSALSRESKNELCEDTFKKTGMRTFDGSGYNKN